MHLYTYKIVTELRATMFIYFIKYINSLSIVIVTYRSIEININQVSSSSFLSSSSSGVQVSLTRTDLIVIILCYCSKYSR